MDKDLSDPEWAGVADIVRQSFSKWEQVSTASLRIENPAPGFLDEDVTASNFGSVTNLPRPENPIVFDADGTIIDSLLGAGASDTVLGFAGIRSSDPQTLSYLYGFALLNGLQTGQAARFASVTLHEIGHLLGFVSELGKARFFGRVPPECAGPSLISGWVPESASSV